MTTDPKPMTMSPSYLAMVRGTRELHQLLAAGKDDSLEADALRDATDGPWQALSELERNRVRNLSEDLYSLTEAPPPPQPMNPQAQAKLLETFEARKQGEWDRALDLLRRWRAYIDPSLVSYLRGSIWLEAGDPETAALFYRHAYKLEPANGIYQAMALYCLNLVSPSAALKEATEILKDHEKFSPSGIARAADITFMAARLKSDTDANRVFQQLEPILTNTIARMQRGDPNEIDRSTYVTLLSLLGFGYEFLGKTQVALQLYSDALRIEPNDALYVARGMLLYGTSAQAITDFETAMQHGTPLVWPYVMLAHHHLLTGRFEESLRLCEQAIRIGGSATVMSEVCEWMAIAQTHLGFPADIVRASFDKAIRLDPSNERAKRNLAAFEAASRPIRWETRTTGAVRTSGLAERRYAMAA
ncbi:MAG: tetratricopeptide repeat protein [Gemmataceae bacterium]